MCGRPGGWSIILRATACPSSSSTQVSAGPTAFPPRPSERTVSPEETPGSCSRDWQPGLARAGLVPTLPRPYSYGLPAPCSVIHKMIYENVLIRANIKQERNARGGVLIGVLIPMPIGLVPAGGISKPWIVWKSLKMEITPPASRGRCTGTRSWKPGLETRVQAGGGALRADTCFACGRPWFNLPARHDPLSTTRSDP